MIADVDKAKTEELVKQLMEEKFEAMAISCDVSNVESIKQAAAKTGIHFGNPDILINGAFIMDKKKLFI